MTAAPLQVVGAIGGPMTAAPLQVGEPIAAALQDEHTEPAEHEDHTALEWTLMLISTAMALSGIGLAYRVYAGGRVADEPLKRFAAPYRMLWNKYWVDEAYDAALVNRVKDVGRALWVLDDAVVDGTVNGVANATLQTATASDEFDSRVIDGTVDGVASVAWSGSRVLRALQTGYVQNYALIIAVGVFVLVSAYLLF